MVIIYMKATSRAASLPLYFPFALNRLDSLWHDQKGEGENSKVNLCDFFGGKLNFITRS